MSTEPALPIPAVEGIPGFWDELRSASSSFLALDYDGTCAPFKPERMEAYPLAGIPELIARIRDRTQGSIAVISGRPVAELEQLLDVPGILKVGSHGYEFRSPDGALEVREPTPKQRKGLSMAWDAGVREGLSRRVEPKVASLALHTRGVPEVQARAMEQLAMGSWMPFVRLHDLELRRFNGGIELRCLGMDKGSALLTVLSSQRKDAFCVYIGDDETDEDAFRVLKGRGVGIRVGRTEAPTHAAGFLPDTQAVKDFLQGWAVFTPAGSQGGISWKKEDWR